MEKDIIVYSDGRLLWRDKEYKCALGKGGVREDKKEGDGATPVGCFPVREIYYRADRLEKPITILSDVRELKEADGWCDGVEDENYNKFVLLPYGASSENLWRNDHIYDVIVVLGYNDDPIIKGKGSAVFMHVARENYSPTAGCIALSLPDLLAILSTIIPDTNVCVLK